MYDKKMSATSKLRIILTYMAMFPALHVTEYIFLSLSALVESVVLLRIYGGTPHLEISVRSFPFLHIIFH